MELIKASVTTASPLTVTIDGSSAPIPVTLLGGTPAAGALCYLMFLSDNQVPPLVLIPPIGGASAPTKAQIDALRVDADTLDGIDSTGFATTSALTSGLAGKLGASSKAADSDLLDGIDSPSFTRARSTASAGGDPSLPVVSSANMFLMTGCYNLTGTNTNGPWGNADGRWWFLQVMAHAGTNQWQRQVAWDMTGGTDLLWTRRGSDNGSGGITWSAWVSK